MIGGINSQGAVLEDNSSKEPAVSGAEKGKFAQVLTEASAGNTPALPRAESDQLVLPATQSKVKGSAASEVKVSAASDEEAEYAMELVEGGPDGQVETQGDATSLEEDASLASIKGGAMAAGGMAVQGKAPHLPSHAVETVGEDKTGVMPFKPFTSQIGAISYKTGAHGAGETQAAQMAGVRMAPVAGQKGMEGLEPVKGELFLMSNSQIRDMAKNAGKTRGADVMTQAEPQLKDGLKTMDAKAMAALTRSRVMATMMAGQGAAAVAGRPNVEGAVLPAMLAQSGQNAPAGMAAHAGQTAQPGMTAQGGMVAQSGKMAQGGLTAQGLTGHEAALAANGDPSAGPALPGQIGQTGQNQPAGQPQSGQAAPSAAHAMHQTAASPAHQAMLARQKGLEGLDDRAAGLDKGQTAPVAGVDGTEGSHGLTALGATAAPGLADGGPVETGRQFVERVAQEIRYSVANHRKEMTLRLNPEHLGEMKLKVTEEKGALKVEMAVENSAAKSLLESRLQEIRLRLEENNFQKTEFVVTADLNSGGGFESGNRFAGFAERGFTAPTGGQGVKVDEPLAAQPVKQAWGEEGQGVYA